MKFKSIYKRERKAQSFDPEHTIDMAGKQVSVYDMIQKNREDTEIYPTLEKYGTIERMKLDAKKVYADFTAFKDTRSMLDQQKMAEKMWWDLPFDVRKEFDNNMHTFIKGGEKYLKEKIKAQEVAQPTPVEPTTETKGE